MELPEFFQLADGYAIYRPVAEVLFEQVIEMAAKAIEFCRDHGIGKLVQDSTQLMGFEPPTTVQKFLQGERMAAAAESKVIGAVVTQPRMIDPQAPRMAVWSCPARRLAGSASFDQTLCGN